MRVYSGKQRQAGRVLFYRMSSRVREKLFGCPIVGFTWFLGLWTQAEKLSVVTEIFFFSAKAAHNWGYVVYFLRCESIKKKKVSQPKNQTKRGGLYQYKWVMLPVPWVQNGFRDTQSIFLLTFRTASMLETLSCTSLLRQHSKPPLPRNCGVKGPCFFSSLISLYNV